MTVTLQKSGTSESELISTDTAVTFVHNEIWQLIVSADFNYATNGKIKITVAPGLKIDRYPDAGAESNCDSIERSLSAKEIPALEGYNFPYDCDTLTYTVSSTAARVNLNLTLSVDTVLWPKIDGWVIDDAIKVEFSEDSGAAVTKTADITVDCATDPNASWNQLYISDPNKSVPTTADKDFRMKTIQISPNLHGSALGFYYPELTVTVPLPKVDSENIYASYSKIESNFTDPTVEEKEDHTVTFTWTNLYVPAGNNLILTPYFKWSSSDSVPKANDTVVFSDYTNLKATATIYSASASSSLKNIDFKKSDSEPKFTALDSKSININDTNTKGARTIFNYGSDTQVYLLGQFHVRNDGFEETGPLTLTFTYEGSVDVAHVIAQGIPVGTDGKVTSIKYTTNMQTSLVDVTSEISDANYRNTGSNRSYILNAPNGEYFTKIIAEISGFPAQFVGYNNSAEMSPSNGAVTYGKMAEKAITGEFSPSLTINSGGDSVSNTYKSTITSGSKQTTQMRVIPVSGTIPFSFNGIPSNSVQLGIKDTERTIHYSGYISATEYPYTNSQVVDRPVIYIRLPEKITVKNVTLYSSETSGVGSKTPPAEKPVNNIDYTFTPTPYEGRGGEGYHVYEIKFNEGTYTGALGWFNENLGETRLKLEFDMVADTNITQQTLKMNETIFVGYADGSEIGASGSLANNQQ